MPRSPQWLFPSGFPTKILYTPPLSTPIRATCPAHLILLDFITRTILGEEYKSFSSTLCYLLHSPVTSSLLGPNIKAVLLPHMFHVHMRNIESVSISKDGASVFAGVLRDIFRYGNFISGHPVTTVPIPAKNDVPHWYLLEGGRQKKRVWNSTKFSPGWLRIPELELLAIFIPIKGPLPCITAPHWPPRERCGYLLRHCTRHHLPLQAEPPQASRVCQNCSR